MNKKKVLFIYQLRKSFVQKDIEILEEIADVETVQNYPFSWAGSWRLIRKVRECDLLITWFVGQHSILPLLLAKVMGKRILAIAGGWDVAKVPEIDYGLMSQGIQASIGKFLFSLADRICCVSNSNCNEFKKNVSSRFVPVDMIYHGFKDPDPPRIRKEKCVITVGDVTRNNLERKGLKKFVEVAGRFQDIPFILIGKHCDDSIETLRKTASKNVHFKGFVTNEELESSFQKAWVYAQFSQHEAFGCSVAEAMLYRCVPVVSDQYALPEVVGDAGYVTALHNQDEMFSAVQNALEDDQKGEMARQRVLTCFPLSLRKKQLQNLVWEIMKS